MYVCREVGWGGGEGGSDSYKLACTPSEDSDQPAHPHRSLWIIKDPKCLQADSEDSDQNARPRRPF